MTFGNLELPNLDYVLRGRVKELWKPLLQVARLIGGDCWQVLSTGVKQTVEAKMEARQNSLEGRLTYVVVELIRAQNSLEVPFDLIWSELERNLEAQQDAHNPNLIHSPEFGDITKQSIGRRLGELFDAKRSLKKVGGEAVRVRTFSGNKVARMARKYGCDFRLVTEVTGVTDSPGVSPSVTLQNERFEGQINQFRGQKREGNLWKSVTSVTDQNERFSKGEENKPIFNHNLSPEETENLKKRILGLHDQTEGVER
jgi:hypothetical protein